MHMCATYEDTAINIVRMGPVHIFDMYYLTNMVATLYTYIQMHFYCSASVDPTLVHT